MGFTIGDRFSAESRWQSRMDGIRHCLSIKLVRYRLIILCALLFMNPYYTFEQMMKLQIVDQFLNLCEDLKLQWTEHFNDFVMLQLPGVHTIGEILDGEKSSSLHCFCQVRYRIRRQLGLCRRRSIGTNSCR